MDEASELFVLYKQYSNNGKIWLMLGLEAFRNMLHNGLSQSERIILRHCFLTDGYMSQQIRGQINNGVPVSCVWIFDGSEVRVLYNTEG